MHSFFGAVADDFTGACDAGIQFRKHGLKTVALIGDKRLPGKVTDFDMIVIDTETRNLEPEKAYATVRQALNSLGELGIKIVYKKIDSTLRGNIGAELDAVLDVLNIDAALVTPTYAEQGRTVANGLLFVNNILVTKTEFASDPTNPIQESHIPSLIRQQTSRKVGQVDLSKAREGVVSIRTEIQALIERDIQIIVADSETKGDLANIAEAIANMKILPCGSAGLAEKIASSFSIKNRVLVVAGSVNEVTLRQIAYIQKELDMTVLKPESSKSLKGDEGVESAATVLAEKACEAFNKGKDVVLSLTESREALLGRQEKRKHPGIGHALVPSGLLLVLGKTVKKILDSQKLGGLILVGGDTSIEVMKAINAEGVTLEAEVLPGISMGRILGGKHEGMKVATKAGGFGDKRSLVELVRRLRCMS